MTGLCVIHPEDDPASAIEGITKDDGEEGAEATSAEPGRRKRKKKT